MNITYTCVPSTWFHMNSYLAIFAFSCLPFEKWNMEDRSFFCKSWCHHPTSSWIQVASSNILCFQHTWHLTVYIILQLALSVKHNELENYLSMLVHDFFWLIKIFYHITVKISIHWFLAWGIFKMFPKFPLLPIILGCISLSFFQSSPKDRFPLILEREWWWWEREREKERERERDVDVTEKHWLPPVHVPTGNPQPGHLPSPGIEPTAFQCMKWCSTQLSHTAMAWMNLVEVGA